MKKMVLKELNVQSFTTTDKIKGGTWESVAACYSVEIPCTDAVCSGWDCSNACSWFC